MKIIVSLVLLAAMGLMVASVALADDKIKVKSEYYTPYGKVKVKEYRYPYAYPYPYYAPYYQPPYNYYSPPTYYYNPYSAPPPYYNPYPYYGKYKVEVDD